MRISSNNYPNVISDDISYTNSGTAKTTVQQRLEMLSTPSKPVETETTEEKSVFGFSDLIDIVNPLQHIPVVSSIYRKVTGDEVGAIARIAGGGLFGGGIGAFFGAFESAVKGMTGKDLGEHALAMATYNQNNQTIETAENKPAIISNNDSLYNNNYQAVSTKDTANTSFDNYYQKNNNYSNTVDDTSSEAKDSYMPLKKEDRLFPLNSEPKTFEISRETKEKTFDLNTQKQLNYMYIPQMMPLDFAENTLEASKVSHIKKDNKESIDFWSRPINSNLSSENAFIASSLNDAI